MHYYICRYCREVYKTLGVKKNMVHCTGRLVEITKKQYTQELENNEHKNK